MVDLLVAARAANSVYSFARADAVLTALNTVGGVHMASAENVLRHLAGAADAREAVNRALTHLEAAHVAFKQLWHDGSELRRYSRDQHAKKDALTCCLIAMCHKALGDRQDLITLALNDAEKALEFESDHRMAQAAHVVSPVFWYDVFTTDVVPQISNDEIAEIKSILKS